MVDLVLRRVVAPLRGLTVSWSFGAWFCVFWSSGATWSRRSGQGWGGISVLFGVRCATWCGGGLRGVCSLLVPVFTVFPGFCSAGSAAGFCCVVLRFGGFLGGWVVEGVVDLRVVGLVCIVFRVAPVDGGMVWLELMVLVCAGVVGVLWWVGLLVWVDLLCWDFVGRLEKLPRC